MALSSYLLCFLVSVVLSLLFTRWVRDWAVDRGYVTAPELERHVHKHPVPRLGGLAICASFMIAVGVSFLSFHLIGLPRALPLKATFGLLGPAFIVFLLGLYDDLHSVKPHWKFGIEGIAAVVLYFGGFGIHQIDLWSWGHALRTVVGLPLTVLWVLLITNAFNLIDGLDGLAAGSALFSTIVVFVMSLLVPNSVVTLLTIALAGAIVGFLRFNFYPASIFLGDSGSLFIGFTLSALALAGSEKAPTIVAVAIPVVSFGLPILDVALAVIRRFLSGKPLFSADGDHIHHKLLKRGLRQREAVLILYAVTAGFGLLSLAMLHGGGTSALILTVIGIGVWLGVQHLRYVEFFELQSVFQRTIQHKRVVANNLRVRRAAESLSSCTDLPGLCRILEGTMQPLGFDGFRFRNSSTVNLSKPELGPLYGSMDGEFRCCWSGSEPVEPGWELRLQLTTSTGYKWGYFALFRSHAEDDVLLDINVLNSEFRAQLCNALQGVVSRARLTTNTAGADRSDTAAQVVSA
jgi:UDP-GlcNAc:undecaprenyl-phosphate/decaprenyl-phosphate GlcNAc-1-phosphate transferase